MSAALAPEAELLEQRADEPAPADVPGGGAPAADPAAAAPLLDRILNFAAVTR